jgi:plastocyanin
VSFRGPWNARRPVPSAGAGLLAFILGGLSVGGCGAPSTNAGEEMVAEAEALGLGARAELHRVTLGGRGAEEHAVPTRLIIESGDAVEFWTADHRVHTVRFPVDSLGPGSRQFLEGTGQLAGPPLVSRGSRFVVRFEDAPNGRYPFEVMGHGGVARGVVEVGDLAADSTDAGGGP